MTSWAGLGVGVFPGWVRFLLIWMFENPIALPAPGGPMGTGAPSLCSPWLFIPSLGPQKSLVRALLNGAMPLPCIPLKNNIITHKTWSVLQENLSFREVV